MEPTKEKQIKYIKLILLSGFRLARCFSVHGMCETRFSILTEKYTDKGECLRTGGRGEYLEGHDEIEG
jgi:hypothetical protein